MPFQSKAQQRFLYAKYPGLAKEFADETPKDWYGKMPEKKAAPSKTKPAAPPKKRK